MENRITKLAEIIINHSTRLQKNDNIWIDCRTVYPLPLAREIIRLAMQKGAVPHFNLLDMGVTKTIIANGSAEQFKKLGELHYTLMQQMQAYVAIRGEENIYDQSDLNFDKMQQFGSNYYEKIHKYRIDKTKWVVMIYPTPGRAQLAKMSFDEFEDFYFKVCTLDYSKMRKAMDPLIELMQKTDKVRITGVDTDISFSIKGLPPIPCSGEYNLPDGEIYTAPVLDSVNGTISYNAPSMYKGKVFENIRFEFKKGKIVKATCKEYQEELNKILDIDEGARYIGEFAIGINPYVTKPMLDTLFDEKIYGSIHLTPGSAYENCFNGNKSQEHWDLVLIQTPEFGGGEMYFDDVLIRKDGEFVHPKLKSVLSKKALI